MTSLRSYVSNFFSVRHAFQAAKQQWVLELMLLSLHGVVLWGFSSPLSKALVLTHYGLFLLWQHLSGASKLTSRLLPLRFFWKEGC